MLPVLEDLYNQRPLLFEPKPRDPLAGAPASPSEPSSQKRGARGLRHSVQVRGLPHVSVMVERMRYQSPDMTKSSKRRLDLSDAPELEDLTEGDLQPPPAQPPPLALPPPAPPSAAGAAAPLAPAVEQSTT